MIWKKYWFWFPMESLSVKSSCVCLNSSRDSAKPYLDLCPCHWTLRGFGQIPFVELVHFSFADPCHHAYNSKLTSLLALCIYILIKNPIRTWVRMQLKKHLFLFSNHKICSQPIKETWFLFFIFFPSLVCLRK